ncbi:membrane protein [Pontibacillus marinus BH030004 = DSM 16465]|uniref:Membrane protein n=1 Tax=Pontibacillus marinus BH030004 = DSM 16465 TaxID=1385511 RepID=A0A0A5GCB8_9BACI|nr:hypothetical protein [Pontibacillus marinus]KGX89659.1 membrane protein [Pontibacillus marinus BH030004 = DSM 16465]
MILVLLFSVLTILSVFFALHKKKPILLGLPFLAIFTFMLIKIMLVPLPFWETVRFIFNLRG